jgi:hypothetical protein
MEREGVRERAAGAGGLLLIGILILLLAKGLYPAELPASRNPDFIDNVFDNRGVLWAARLLLVSAAGVLAIGGVFIVVSIAVRMKNGEWLRRAGPLRFRKDPRNRPRMRRPSGAGRPGLTERRPKLCGTASAYPRHYWKS